MVEAKKSPRIRAGTRVRRMSILEVEIRFLGVTGKDARQRQEYKKEEEQVNYKWESWRRWKEKKNAVVYKHWIRMPLGKIEAPNWIYFKLSNVIEDLRKKFYYFRTAESHQTSYSACTSISESVLHQCLWKHLFVERATSI